VIMYQLTDT